STSSTVSESEGLPSKVARWALSGAGGGGAGAGAAAAASGAASGAELAGARVSGSGRAVSTSGETATANKMSKDASVTGITTIQSTGCRRASASHGGGTAATKRACAALSRDVRDPPARAAAGREGRTGSEGEGLVTGAGIEAGEGMGTLG